MFMHLESMLFDLSTVTADDLLRTSCAEYA